MPDLARLAELHVIPVAKSRDSLSKICILCIHETRGAVEFTGKLTTAGDMRSNVDVLKLQSQLQRKAVQTCLLQFI